MKKNRIFFSKIILFLFFLSVGFSVNVKAQYSFDYIHWSGDGWHVDIVKSFNQGSDMPEVRFKHTRNGQSHYENFMDYKSDAGENWRAFIKYRIVGNNVEFYFTHCKGGGSNCHDDVIINLLAYGSANKQIRLQPCSIADFKINTEYIKGDDRSIPKPPVGQGATPSTSTGNSIVNPRYTVDKSRSDWVIKFQTHSKIRVHADSGFSPALEMTKNPGDEVIIKPGQWAESWFYINGSYTWSLMTDTDHR